MVADSREKGEENVNKCLSNWFYLVAESVKLSIKAIINWHDISQTWSNRAAVTGESLAVIMKDLWWYGFYLANLIRKEEEGALRITDWWFSFY